MTFSCSRRRVKERRVPLSGPFCFLTYLPTKSLPFSPFHRFPMEQQRLCAKLKSYTEAEAKRSVKHSEARRGEATPATQIGKAHNLKLLSFERNVSLPPCNLNLSLNLTIQLREGHALVCGFCSLQPRPEPNGVPRWRGNQQPSPLAPE